MKDFRGPLPLTDDDFAAIRRNVMAEVRRKRTPVWIALPIAAAIALAFVLWPAKETREVAQIPVAAVSRPAASITQDSAPRTQHSVHVAQARTPAHQPARRRRSEPMRIEMQTSDPNVRIIWIVQ